MPTRPLPKRFAASARLTPALWRATALLAAAFLAAVLARPAPAQQPVDAIVMRVGLDKPKALVGEPVALRLFATNVSTGAVELNSQFYAAGHVLIVIEWPDDLPQRFTGLMKPGMYAGMSYNLEPGETREIKFVDSTLFYRVAGEGWPEGLLFDRPVKVRIGVQVAYTVNMQAAPAYVAPPLELEIVEPHTDADQQVLARIRASAPLARALQTSVCELADAPLIEQLLESYPGSACAPHLRMALLGGLAYGRDDADTSATLTARLNQALLAADALEAAYPGYPHLDETLYRRAVAYNRLGRPREAMDELLALANRFPLSGRLHKGDKTTRRYLFPDRPAFAPVPWNMTR